jgi:hypothetical protein
MANRPHIRLNVGWRRMVLFLLGGSIVLALVVSLAVGPEQRRQGDSMSELSALSTPVPTATATLGWWGDVEGELSILATPTLSVTFTVTPTTAPSQ